MLLAINSVKFKLLAVVVAVALVVPFVLMPVGAAHAQESVKETNTGITVSGSLPQEVIDAINSEGAEIEIRGDGTPVIVVEIEEKEEIYYIPIDLPSTVEVINEENGSKITAEVDGNYLLIPVVEDGETEIERACISDFDVRKAIKNDDGQITLQLQSEVNPEVLIRVYKGGILFISQVVGTALFIDHLWNRAHTTCTEDVPISGRDGRASYDFQIPVPSSTFDLFRVDVTAYDVDKSLNETINVYFESYDEQYRVHLGTLTQGDDRKSTWTVLRAPETSLRGIYKFLDNLPPGDEGKFRIVKESSG